MPLDPWIIDEILKKEREERERREREQQPTVEIDSPQETPAQDSPKPGHEMPVERKPGYEMPDPGAPARTPEKKDDEPNRGVDISRITGSDDEEEDGAIVIDIKKLPTLPSEDPEKKAPEKKPD